MGLCAHIRCSPQVNTSMSAPLNIHDWRSFVAYNALDDTSSMRCIMPFSFAECTCTRTQLDPGCNKYYVGIPYGDLCRNLKIQPNGELYLSGVVPAPLQVVYPWQEYEAPPGDDESTFGSKADHDLAENPFAWVDHTNPIVYVPVHKCTTPRVGFQGVTFYLAYAQM